MSDDDLHAVVAGRLAEVRQRYTPSRRTLVDVLAGAGRPLTIPEVLRGRRGVPQSSAYRNLTALEQAGVVRRVQADDEFARWELAEDLTRHHHHLVCVGCGHVADYTVPERVERSLARAFEQAAAATGFQAHGHRVDLVGLCAACR